MPERRLVRRVPTGASTAQGQKSVVHAPFANLVGAATSLTAPSRAVLGRDVQDATMETSPVVNDDTDDHVHDERTFGTVAVDGFLLG